MTSFEKDSDLETEEKDKKVDKTKSNPLMISSLYYFDQPGPMFAENSEEQPTSSERKKREHEKMMKQKAIKDSKQYSIRMKR